MSPAPDPTEISAPKDPADYRAPRVMGPLFWGMMVFGLLCVLAGAAIALVLPRLLAAKPTPPPAAEAALPVVDAPPVAPAAVTVPAPDAPAPVAGVGSEDIERLNARIAALETQEKSTAHAAAAALAAAALVEATQGSGPFVEELAALRGAAPGAPELAVLTRLAEVGAPSRAALAARFPDYAARAASAARAPGEAAGLGDRVVYALSKIVSVRRVGEVAGSGPDAQLARAERLVEDGDLDAALRALDTLSPAGREAMAPWRARAERRAEIDRQASALRVRALRDLAQAPRSGA
ncbi:MAG: mitofilin family membrane protein [Phenylobacterium sp.]